jgi:ParB family chromosome partitioning protein
VSIRQTLSRRLPSRVSRQSSGEAEAQAGVLAREIALDMVAYWQPTAAGYFNRVSKERILQAVREGASAQVAGNIARMKKPAMALAAEAALAGKNWLPGTAPWPDRTLPRDLNWSRQS